MKRMILASGSPRRKELLQMLEVPFEVLVSDTKEVITKNEPAEVTKELSYQKAMAVAGQVEEGIIIGADTVVSIDGKILGKEFSFPPSVGVFIEKPGFLDSYSGFQNLMMLASIKGQISGAEVKDVLKRVGLQDVMYKKYRKYSLGMKQKLGIAAAIMEKPELIILDEPSNALDEKSEEILWQIVGEEKERGALILISCHTTETLEKVSDEIFRMDMGQIKEHMTV